MFKHKGIALAAAVAGAGLFFAFQPPAHATAETWADLHLTVENTIVQPDARMYFHSLVGQMESYDSLDDIANYNDTLSFFVDELIAYEEDLGVITQTENDTVYGDLSSVSAAVLAVKGGGRWRSEEDPVVQNFRCENRKAALCLNPGHCKIKWEKDGLGNIRNRRCENA